MELLYHASSTKRDGAGFPPERLRELKASLQKDSRNLTRFIERGEHIGIRNVNARLCLCFYIPEALHLLNRPGGGTVADIRIPFSDVGGRQA